MSTGSIVPTVATSQFPGCALSCTTLLQAEQLCTPPNAATASQLTYDNCFCSTSFLQAFITTPDAVCIDYCTIETDRQLLQAWFNGFCATVRQGTDPVAITATSAAAIAAGTTGTTLATSTIAGTSAATIAGTGTPNTTPHSVYQEPWLKTHWQWILCVVILAVGLGGLAALAVWLKRRYRRKAEARRILPTGLVPADTNAGVGPPGAATRRKSKRASEMSQTGNGQVGDLWGPHQMMNHTQGFSYDVAPTISQEQLAERAEKRASSRRSRHMSDRLSTPASKGAADENVIEIVPSRPTTKRARASELEMNARMIGAADRNSKRRDASRLSKNRTEDGSPSGAEKLANLETERPKS